MRFQVKPFANGLPHLLQGVDCTSELLARADLLELLDEDLFRALEERASATQEDFVRLLNRYLRLGLASEKSCVSTDVERTEP